MRNISNVRVKVRKLNFPKILPFSTYLGVLKFSKAPFYQVRNWVSIFREKNKPAGPEMTKRKSDLSWPKIITCFIFFNIWIVVIESGSLLWEIIELLICSNLEINHSGEKNTLYGWQDPISRWNIQFLISNGPLYVKYCEYH